MREIKFRGKSLVSKYIPPQWWYGGIMVDGEDVWICVKTEEKGVVSVKVNPSTIGQYTGLKDKEGREIYEGDIIKDLEGIVYEICWYADLASFIAEIMESEKPFYIYDVEVDKCEVLGNIHERKEQMI